MRPPAGTWAGPGLYLHVPFCSAICPYCDFAVTTGGAAARRRFRQALVTEIALRAEAARELAGGAAFDTLYLGGGTPSLLAPRDLEAILEAARRELPLAEDPWILLEANPEDAGEGNLAAWRRLGVRTVSLGVQSFDAASLAFLGRRHTRQEARAAVVAARAAGLATVSLDLIYGLPGQDIESWRRELEAAVALAPDHLSCYQLTVEPGTPFARRRARGALAEPPEETLAGLFRATHELLATAGYPAYEVSNFARAPEHRSKHNLKYWRHTPYLGLGPSAHSFDGTGRWWNERHPAAWLARIEAGVSPVAGREELSREQLVLERVMLGLRTAAGIDLAQIERRWGIDLRRANGELFARWEAQGLARERDGCLVPTLAGLVVCEELARSVAIPFRRPGSVAGS